MKSFRGRSRTEETVSEVIKYGRYGRIFSRGNYIEKSNIYVHVIYNKDMKISVRGVRT